MKYRAFFNAIPALRTMGSLRTTKVALAAKRVVAEVNAELDRFREFVNERAAEAGLEEKDRAGRLALLEQLADSEDVEGFEITKPVQWKHLPPDSLSGLEIADLETIGALVGVPEE